MESQEMLRYEPGLCGGLTNWLVVFGRSRRWIITMKGPQEDNKQYTRIILDNGQRPI